LLNNSHSNCYASSMVCWLFYIKDWYLISLGKP
jgi:hypothetical protein